MTTTSRTRRARLAATAIAAGALAGSAMLAAAGTGPASAAGLPGPVPTPLPGPCQVIDFRTATVDPVASTDPSTTDYHLTVTGLLPFPAKVTLQPLVYFRQPEHWGIEVTACPVPTPGPIMPRNAMLPVPFRVYQATLDFHGPMGTCGIDVIGATTSQSFDLAGPKACGEIDPAA